MIIKLPLGSTYPNTVAGHLKSNNKNGNTKKWVSSWSMSPSVEPNTANPRLEDEFVLF